MLMRAGLTPPIFAPSMRLPKSCCRPEKSAAWGNAIRTRAQMSEENDYHSHNCFREIVGYCPAIMPIACHRLCSPFLSLERFG